MVLRTSKVLRRETPFETVGNKGANNIGLGGLIIRGVEDRNVPREDGWQLEGLMAQGVDADTSREEDLLSRVPGFATRMRYTRRHRLQCVMLG